MSNLGPQQQNASYDGVLQIPGGVTAQLQQVQDGEGRATGLFLSSAGSNAATAASFAASVNGVSLPDVVPRLISDGFGDYVSVKDFGATGDGVADDTDSIQNALNNAWSLGLPLFVPDGVYLVTGLTVNQTSTTQNKMLRIYGTGAGNPFAAWSSPLGSVFKSVTDGPVFTMDVDTTTHAGGLYITGLIFDGATTSAPVVYLKSFYGTSVFEESCVFQRGDGVGLQVDWMATGEIRNCYFLNKDWAIASVGSSRTSIGVYINQQYDAGLQTIRKCSSRGWLTAYQLGSSVSATTRTYSAAIRDSECSTTYNGIVLNGARSSVIDNCYFEGGDGGVGIYDRGDYNKVTNCFTFAGYSTHLKSDDATYGNVYTGNTFSIGTSPNQTLVSITSDAGKVLSDNHFSFGGSGGTLVNVVGVQINGVTPRLDMSGNSFNPRQAWIGGAGTYKIANNSTATWVGSFTGLNADYEFPMLSQASISLFNATLTETAFSGGALTVPQGSYFDVTPTTPISVNRLTLDGVYSGVFLVLNSTNANLTIADSAYIRLNGGTSFVGSGAITFIVNKIGGSYYAIEIARMKD